MSPWLTVSIVLYIGCLSPQGAFGENLKCWWHKITADGSVSVMCQADNQSSMLKYPFCHLVTHEAAHDRQVSRINASFSMFVEEQEMQNVTCKCPEQQTLNCVVQKGYPAPTCLIPVNENGRNIHCHWAGPQRSCHQTNFTLHWEDDDGSSHKDVGQNQYGIIPRTEYATHSFIRVWVSASCALGTVDSEAFETFSTETIIQPASPRITNHIFDPLEIFWEVTNEAGHTGEWQCKVQYRMQCEKTWTERKDFFQVSFFLEDAMPWTTYVFRVRCWIASDEESSVMSEWSKEYSVETPAAAPVGKPDVWSDCDLHSDSSCAVFWKELPKDQARGIIKYYVVTAKLKNGSDLILDKEVTDRSVEICAQYNMETDGKQPVNVPSCTQNHLRCSQEWDQNCFLYRVSIPVGEVNDVQVIAKTMQGKSGPALVAFPKNEGHLQSHCTLKVKAEEKELNISWSIPSSHHVQEYVVQIGLLNTSCLNWVKVSNKQKFVTVRGLFSNYTAYNVSLFAVINNSSFLLKSVITYIVEGVPPKVPEFSAINVSSYTANLTWTPIPLHNARGHVQQYIVGLINHSTEHIVASNESYFQLHDLRPGQQYEAWICAASAVGRGETMRIGFLTTQSDKLSLLIGLPLALFLFFFAVGFWMWTKLTVISCRIPDPINSTSFKQMSNQFWQSWPGPSSNVEHCLIISHVEIIAPFQPELEEEKSMLPDVQQQEEQIVDLEEEDEEMSEVLQRTDSLPLRRRNEYSQVIDTSDEDEFEESFEKPCSSDYEKHFLPCVLDC